MKDGNYQDLKNNYYTINANVPGVSAANGIYYNKFASIAFASEIVEGWASWTVAGGANATASVYRLTQNVSAISAGNNVLSATFDLTGTANSVHRIRAQSAISARILNVGDRLALSSSGTLTGATDFVLTLVVRPINTNPSFKDTP